MKQLGSLLLVFGVMSAMAGRIEAQSLVTDRASLGGTDMIYWSQLGSSYTQITNPATVTTTGGSTDVVAQVSGNGIILQQSVSWGGNFAPGDYLYYTQNAFNGNDQGPVTLTFGKGVGGVGAQIQENYYGGFTAFISAYDSSNHLLGSFTENGASNGNGDNSAIFIGILSSSANIASVVFGLTNGGNGPTPDFALNEVSINTTGQVIPEPSSLLLASLGGLGVVAYGWRRRKNARVVTS